MRSVASIAALAGAASAALTTTAYTDSTTGISFQQYTDSSSGFKFGMALPEKPGKDFIGQIIAPGSGWAGISLTSSMMSSLLIAAWPNDDDVVASIRKTTTYTNPAAYDGDAKLYPIAEGVSVNSTHYTYTFLCKDCVVGDSSTFKLTAETAVLGWAVSDDAPTSPASADAKLVYHSTGFGAFGMPIAKAESADYDTWAALASSTAAGSGSTGTSSGSGSASTPASTPVNTPLPAATTAKETYDYIVIGGGAAGIVAAERFAESKKSVLLLERGGASTFSTGGKDTLSWNSSVTAYDVPAYGYKTSGSELCDDTASSAGCLVGGSSSINAEMFVRPQEADFENWPQGWKYSDISESAESFYERNPGTDKPSSDGRYYNQGVFSVLSKLFTSNGWSEVSAIEKPNEKTKVFAHPPWNIKNGLRAGPVRTYLPLAQAMDNFKFQTGAKVLKLVRSGSAVTGVEVQLEDGSTQIINVNADGKVVLASGALSTPRILFNSGIGPADQIKTVKSGTSGVTIPDEADWIELPVGKGLKDHPIFSVSVNAAQANFTEYDPTNPTKNEISLFAQGAGPLSEGMQRLNFWTSVEGSDGVTRYIQGTTAATGDNGIKIKVYLTHGLTSTGTLGITADGTTTFTTEPWMNTDGDKAAVKSFMTDLIAYIKKDSSLSIESTTGEEVTAESLMATHVTGDHFVGTAKMGADKSSAVVDTDCKVFGTDNLFIVDASIHPDLPTGNTQAIVMVVSEHAAKKIVAKDTKISTASASSGSASTPAASSVAASSVVASSAAAPSSSVAAASEETSSAVQQEAVTSSAAVVSHAATTAAAGEGFVTTTTIVVTQAITSTIYVDGGASASAPTAAAAAENVAAAAVNAAAVNAEAVSTSAEAAATGFATSVVAAAGATVTTIGNANGNVTASIPSGILTSVIPATATATIAGVETPEKALPEGFRVVDLLEWFSYTVEGLFYAEN